MAEQQKKHSRRRFLKIAGGTVAATAIVGGGLVAVGSRRPQVAFQETAYRTTDPGRPRVLIAYASRCGSTGEIADALGQTLHANNLAVDVRLVQHVTDLTPYRAVILGSAIHAGSWLSEAVEFINASKTQLQHLPTAYFLACLTLIQDTEAHRRKVAAYLDTVRKIMEPQAVGMFAGKLDYKKLTFLEGLLMKYIIRAPEADARNWDAITAWGKMIPMTLLLEKARE